MILALKTDQVLAELYICSVDGAIIADKKWEAHRQLAATLLESMQELLKQHGGTWQKLSGVVIFQGPGSFTGLRIGAAVANALADSRDIPVVGSTGGAWLLDGIARLKSGENDKIVLPEYGGVANITAPVR